MKRSTEKCPKKRCPGTKMYIWKIVVKTYETILLRQFTANVTCDAGFLKINSFTSIFEEV